ncbi:hypothetical protein B0T25DRAFT_521265 [Lasiosphaeria hispida]|uniref:Secreted protein n=1 Tax=Lasiosphaeria hispida TaxID=260671 RepID=A0AAJ0HCZ5_9PEZI|nr:hypothetical protein B0T25DRAFT_521265 [Lasiosphaeria hispida]
MIRILLLLALFAGFAGSGLLREFCPWPDSTCVPASLGGDATTVSSGSSASHLPCVCTVTSTQWIAPSPPPTSLLLTPPLSLPTTATPPPAPDSGSDGDRDGRWQDFFRPYLDKLMGVVGPTRLD